MNAHDDRYRGAAPLDVKTSRVKPVEGGASFPLRHRILRFVWQITWLLFAAWTPPPLRGWRNLLLRTFGAQVHPTANVYGSARIWYPPNLTMDALASLGPDVDCYCMNQIKIGARAVVSQRAFLCTGTHDIEDPDFQLKTFPIVIGADAWIAAEAFVGPGVHVGEGAVLGARGVAVRDLDAHTVYVGHPAREIKKRRFPEEENV